MWNGIFNLDKRKYFCCSFESETIAIVHCSMVAMMSLVPGVVLVLILLSTLFHTEMDIDALHLERQHRQQQANDDCFHQYVGQTNHIIFVLKLNWRNGYSCNILTHVLAITSKEVVNSLFGISEQSAKWLWHISTWSLRGLQSMLCVAPLPNGATQVGMCQETVQD